MQKKAFDYEAYSSGLKSIFDRCAEEVAISCLMNNHRVWKISFGIIQRWMEDFRAIKEQLGLKDGDRALVLHKYDR